jgi:hypothetical protein
MAKVTISISMEQTKPAFTEADFTAIIAWIKNNILDKLPSDASAHYVLTYTP